MNRLLLLLITLSLSFTLTPLSAHATPEFSLGMIPLEYGQRPATDLIYQGQAILPDQAQELATQGVDLSNLQPAENDLWQIRPWPTPADPRGTPSERIEVAPTGDHVTYIDVVPSRIGNFRFSVTKKLPDGNRKTYVALLSKNVHNVLLRKHLLEKLGYRVPSAIPVAQTTLHFKSYLDKELFLDKMANSTFGDPARWVIDYEKHLKKEDHEGTLYQSPEMVIQDLVLFHSQDHIYNLAIGHIPSATIQGRRVLNALLVPYALTNVPESVNLFEWTSGRIINKQFNADYESADEFSTSYEDARWILKRLANLSRNDFIEIVQKAAYPKEVELLITEKIIARRNHILNLFKVEAFTMNFNPEISYGEHLKDGKLTKENWDGYASRFAYGDPESPFSKSEIFSFIKSRALSAGIDTLLEQINNYLPKLEASTALVQRQQELFFQQLTEYIRTGKIVPVPLGVWATPTAGFNLIASRSVITGNYLGTDNMVQLADSFGFSVNAGVFLNVEGLEAPYKVTGQAQATYNRTYSHLRPITSFKASLKYPFKNMFVPFFKRKLGHFFDDLMSGQFQNMEREQQQKIVTEVMQKFKEQLAIGESILITDSVGGGLNALGGLSLYRLIQAQASFGGSQVVISRLHILRKDENTIQIYKDLGNVRSLLLSFQFKAGVPVLNISAKWNWGSANCKFYAVDITPNETENNPDLLNNLRGLRELFLENSLEYLAVKNRPYILQHKFKEFLAKGSLLFFKIGRLIAQTQLAITHPAGSTKEFIYSQVADRRGINIEQFAIESLNSIMGDFTDWNVHINGINNDAPGDTLKGSSLNLVTTYEGEITKNENGENEIKKPYGRLTQSWRGWSISVKKAREILDDINKKFQLPIYSHLSLAQTTKILFYNISVQIFIYPSAIQYMTNLSRQQVDQIFRTYHTGNIAGLKSYRIRKHLEKYHEEIAKGDFQAAAKEASFCFNYAYRGLSFQGFLRLMGGDENVFVVSNINGFRQGDESGDQTLISHTIGEMGDLSARGPLEAIQIKTGMTQSEFFAYWIMNRLH